MYISVAPVAPGRPLAPESPLAPGRPLNPLGRAASVSVYHEMQLETYQLDQLHPMSCQ